jgi:hypothetical protein
MSGNPLRIGSWGKPGLIVSVMSGIFYTDYACQNPMTLPRITLLLIQSLLPVFSITSPNTTALFQPQGARGKAILSEEIEDSLAIPLKGKKSKHRSTVSPLNQFHGTVEVGPRLRSSSLRSYTISKDRYALRLFATLPPACR